MSQYIILDIFLSGAESTPESTQVPPKCELTRKLNKYRVRLSRANKKLRKKSTVSKPALMLALKDYLPKFAYNFVYDQINYHGVKKKAGLRFSERTKSFSIQLKGISKKAYQLLRKVFVLPCLTTINTILNKIKIEVGFHESVIDALKEKAKSMSTMEKRVIMSFDEMGLKAGLSYNQRDDRVEGYEDYGPGRRSSALADHASVFMARGIDSNWKQPFGYFLSNGPIPGEILVEQLKSGLRQLFLCGLTPVALVMDQGSNNQKAMKLLGSTPDKPYFYLDGKKIITFYDSPHLMKNVRTNLKNSGFDVGEVEALWDHIALFYAHDSKKPIRLAPKLSDAHLNAANFTAMSVKLATQVRTFTK